MLTRTTQHKKADLKTFMQDKIKAKIAMYSITMFYYFIQFMSTKCHSIKVVKWLTIIDMHLLINNSTKFIDIIYVKC